MTLESRGEPAAAVAAFRQALKIQPRFAAVANNLAWQLATSDDRARLEWRQRRYAQGRPTRVHDVAFQGGERLLFSGDFKGAIAQLALGFTHDPHDPEALNRLGVALQGDGQLDRALVAFRRAITARPDFPEAQNNLAWALVAESRLEAHLVEALTLAEAACRATQFREPRFLDTLAVVRAARGDYASAVETLDRAAAPPAATGPIAQAIATRRKEYAERAKGRDLAN